MPATRGFQALQRLAEETISDKITRRILSGEKAMVVWWSMKAGAHAATHAHPHEQIVWLLSGRMTFRVGNETRACGPGDLVVVPGGIDHEAWFPEDAEVVDVFSPPRDDFLQGAPAYMQRQAASSSPQGGSSGDIPGAARVDTLEIATKPFRTRLQRAGAGSPESIVLLHGSGPGASAWSNWRMALPELGKTFDCLAPDLTGFAASEHPPEPPVGVAPWMDLWVQQVISLLDTLGLERVHLVGNSLGGAIALHLAHRHPARFARIALMGPVGVPFTMNEKLDAIWGFYSEPSVDKMREMISWFAYDPRAFSDDLGEIARMRFEAAMDPRVRHSYQAMFPPPRQRHIDDAALPDWALAQIQHPCLIIHGRDDSIVPLETSIYLLQKLRDVRLHVYGRCSHWTQIEYADGFHALLRQFFTAERP